jgi:hypothetical protein
MLLNLTYLYYLSLIKYIIINLNIFNLKTIKYTHKIWHGDWGLGIGDWGLGIGPNPQSPIPNPQSPIPNTLKINKKF